MPSFKKALPGPHQSNAREVVPLRMKSDGPIRESLPRRGHPPPQTNATHPDHVVFSIQHPSKARTGSAHSPPHPTMLDAERRPWTPPWREECQPRTTILGILWQQRIMTSIGSLSATAPQIHMFPLSRLDLGRPESALVCGADPIDVVCPIENDKWLPRNGHLLPSATLPVMTPHDADSPD